MVELNIEGRWRQQFEGVVVILGANGAGKTTLLQEIHGMTRRSVSWDGKSAQGSKAERGFAAQNPVMLSGSVFRNLQMAGVLKGLSKMEAKKEVETVAKKYNLQHLLPRSADKLSAGERALVSFSRAALSAPNVLLLDEITANLDPQNTKAIEGVLREFSQKGVVFFVTHIISQARRLADFVIFVDQGDVIFADDAKKFWHKPSDIRIQKFIAGELD